MKIVGGILTYKDSERKIEQSVKVSWSWFNKSSGTVKWTLENNYNVTKSFVLFRNSYYFGNAFWCFKPDEIILGDNKPVSEYKVGDKVLGESGLVRVVAVGSRYQEKGLIRITPTGMIPLEVTPEHPIFTVRNIHNRSDNKIVEFTHPEFVEAFKLNTKQTNDVGNYVVVPIPEGTYDMTALDISKYAVRVSNAKITKIPLDEDVAWLMGLYCAEGCTDEYDNNNFTFSLNEDEENTVKRIKDTLNRMGFAVRAIHGKGKRISIIGSSRVFAKALKDWMGHMAVNKHIPDFILYHKNLKILWAFIDGLTTVDGSIDDYGRCDTTDISFSTVSKILAEQYQIAWARIGKFASISIWKGGIGNIDGKNIHMRQQYRIRVHFSENPHAHLAKFVGNSIYVPIMKVERIAYSGMVYDLKTEDGTIVAGNVVTHNCVYLANPEFKTNFTSEIVPLINNGVENNSPPLAVVNLNGKYIVCFLFTLEPSQTWSMLEGGFVDGIGPAGVATYDVTSSGKATMCVGYSEQQVTDWDSQTGTSMSGYSPNPSSFTVAVFKCTGPYASLFNDIIKDGKC